MAPNGLPPRTEYPASFPATETHGLLVRPSVNTALVTKPSLVRDRPGA